MSRINNQRAVVCLLLGRLIYAVNFFNLAAIFTLIALDMHQNVSGLGIVVGSFYLGLAAFQIPGGLLAAKIGPKKTAIYGTLLASVAALMVSLSTAFGEIILLRFLVGAGMAFVFAPAVILMAKYFREHAEGFSVGLYNATFYLGGALGIFGWAVLANAWGWRESLAISGSVGIVSAALMLWLVPRDSIRNDFAMEPLEIRKVLSNKLLFLYGLGTLGVNGFSSIITAFTVYYLQNSLNATALLAGSVGALALIASLLSSLLFGKLHDRIRNPAWLLFACGLIGVVGVEFAAFTSVSSTVIANVIVGFATGGGLTVGFSAAREQAKGEYEPLAVSYLNTSQVIAGFFFPPLFSATVLSLGYSSAWTLSGLYVFPFISAVLLSKVKRFSSQAE